VKNKKDRKASDPDNREKKKRQLSPEDREILKMLRAYQIALYGEEWVRYQGDKRANKIK
jgi:hypothetical protein